MTPRERFVHFVALFAPPEIREGALEEALQIPHDLLSREHVDEQGDYGPAVLERPMDAAWEFVQYKRYGAPRPYWMPRIMTPSRPSGILV